MPKKGREDQRPYCFVSYSTREAHVKLLIDCLRMVFTPHFELKLTPPALESGASQLGQIVKLIEGCTFAVVVLDGLRPNVVFEYGILHALNKPVLLFKEADAQVDLSSLLEDLPGLPKVDLKVDSQFSDVKDVHQATWTRFEILATVKLILAEYRKKSGEIQGYIEIREPSYVRED